MLTNKDVYRCYSTNLKEFLMRNGLPYLIVAKDIKTDATFWLFEKTDFCVKLIECWEINSPNRK